MQPAGRRNCLCKLMADSAGELDARGELIPAPQQLAKMWCSIETTSTTEILSFLQQYPAATTRVIAPWTKSVTPTPAMWFEYQGRRLNIVGVDNRLERNEEWWFACTEQVAVRDGDV